MLGSSSTLSEPSGPYWSARLWLSLSLFGFWLLLTQSLQWDSLLAGAVVSLLVVALAPQTVGLLQGFRPSWLFPWHFLQFLAVFIKALIGSNLDMARRVLSPTIPLNPAMVEIETTLQSDLARLILANCITLTPGTLSIDIEANHLLVHWIDCRDPDDLSANTQAIAAPFERTLKRFLQ